MMRTISIFAAMLVSTACFAAKTEPLKILINHGEQTTEFKFDPKTSMMEYSNSHGAKRSRKLSAENYKFVMDEAKKLPAAKNLPFECNRARMSVVFGEGKAAKAKSSCFGMKSITSEQYQKLANLLAVVI